MYAYAASNPVNRADPFGLFTVVSGFDGSGLSFGEFNQARNAYNRTPAGIREQRLRRLGERFQQQIDNACSSDKQELQGIFDNWVVYVDENIDNPATRIRGTAADTWYGDRRTRFNYWFFNSENQYFTFLHEFRHLMDDNEALITDGYRRDRVAGGGDTHPVEIDADRWAQQFSK